MGTEIKGMGGKGVVMEGEGEMVMERVKILQVKTGLEVKSGTVMMKGGEIKGMGTGYGVIMEGGTVTMMDKVGISGVGMGVDAKSGTLKMMGNSTIIFTGDYGVKVGSGVASAILTDVKIRGMGKGYGVIMEGGTVTMDGVWISNVGMGVEVKSGTVMMKRGKIEFTSGDRGYGYGVKVGSGVESAILTDVKIRGMGKGYGVIMEGGTVEMDGVWIEGVSEGVEVKSGTVMMKRGKIEFTSGDRGYGYGVKVGSGVESAILTDVKIRGMGKGYGVIMEGGTVEMMGDSRITFAGGDRGNGNYGVGVGVSGGAVTMMGTRIVGTSGGTGTGVYATGTGKMLMSGVWIEGGGKGVEVSGSGMLEMMGDSTIIFTGGDRGYGVGVEVSGGAVTMMGTKIVGSGKGKGMYGVQMTGDGTMV
ncbi:hypothetical protein m02_10230, partial [Bartonella bovis m02]